MIESSKRISAWSDIYKKQGKRWGNEHSLLAHLAVADMYQNITDSATILDLGCGYGRDLSHIRTCYSNAILDGLDSSKETNRLISPAIEIRQMSYIDIFDFMEKNSQKYDIVFSNYFLHLFYFKEIQSIISYVFSILNNNGLFIFNLVSDKDRHFGKGKKIEYKTYEIFKNILWRFFNIDEAKKLIGEYKFNIIKMDDYSEIEKANNELDLVKAIYIVLEKNK